jgi:hypothetical protein
MFCDVVKGSAVGSGEHVAAGYQHGEGLAHSVCLRLCFSCGVVDAVISLGVMALHLFTRRIRTSASATIATMANPM